MDPKLFHLDRDRTSAVAVAVVIVSTLLAAPFLMACGGAPQWIDRGPDLGGRLSAIVADPGDSQRLLVASPGGGVWRTTDGGASWHKPLNYALADFTVVHLEWDRISSGRLYASTYSDLYATTDFAENWDNLTGSGGYPAPPMPLSHPSDPKPFAQLRYSATASTIFWSKPCSGLSYSYDGSTFTQHWPFSGGAGNEDNCIQAIAADDATGRVYIATMARGGAAHVFRSCPWTATTPCLTWQSASSGLPTNAVVSDIVWGGAADRLALAVAPSASTLVYTTTDGLNWSAASAQPSGNSWDPRPLVRPAGDQLLLGTVVAYNSENWGGSWSQLWYSGMHPDVRAFYWREYPGVPGGFLWATTDGTMASGTYANISRWSFTPGSAPTGGTTVGVSGLKVWQPYVAAATGTPGGSRRRIFLGSLDNGALCSDDSGVSWTTAGTPPGNGCGDYGSIVFAPGNPNRAFARTCSSTAFARSDNALSASSCSAVTWTTLSPSQGHYMPYIWTRAMTAVHPTDPDRVYFARSLDLGVSGDGGSTWTIRTLPDGARPVSVFVDAAGALYVGTLEKGVFKSTDDGVIWTPFALNSQAPEAVLKIAHSTAAGGTFFLATTSGLYRSVSGGSFTLQTADPSYTVSDVEVDHTCPTRVYAAFGYAGNLGGHRGGVLQSTDNGASFTSLTAGLDIHQAPITDIQVDPASPLYLYAAVFGQGMWTYDAGSVPACSP